MRPTWCRELCEKIADLLRTKGAVILPPPRTVLSVAGALSAVVKGNNRKVYVKITETIGMPAADPAAETEIKKLLVTLGFAVVGSRAEADYALIGEGVAADSGNYQRFTSATARVELTLYKGKEQVLAVDLPEGDRRRAELCDRSQGFSSRRPRSSLPRGCCGAEIIRGARTGKEPSGIFRRLSLYARKDGSAAQADDHRKDRAGNPAEQSQQQRQENDAAPLVITASGGKSRQTIRRSASSNAEGTD